MMDLSRLFAESGLNVIFRRDDPGLWSTIQSELTFCPAAYLESSVDYQLAYHVDRGGLWKDISCIIFSDHKAVGIWPLTITEFDNCALLSSQGLPVMPPLFLDDCPDRTMKKISANCLDAVNKIAIELGLKSWESQSINSGFFRASNWHLESMARGAKCRIFHELYVDLSLSLPEIKSRFRKSFRSLITSGQNLWTVQVMSAPGNYGVWNEFKGLHKQVAGRSTRSDNSWQLQYMALSKGEAFLVVLRNAAGSMIGAGYFVCSLSEGIYAVGAYDRNLFDKPLGHVVQWIAINEMKERGCSWYHIGRRFFSADEPAPTQKELSIASFKQGFASHVFPSFLLTHPVELGGA